MKRGTCMIVDDEPAAVDLLETLVLRNTDWRIAAKCYNAVEALDFLKEQKVDFLFLDINMPGFSGLELASMLPKDLKIIFSTASSAHALESYNFSAVDYMLKPITLSRFLAAKIKIESFLSVDQILQRPDEKRGVQYLFFKIGKNLHKVLLEQIFYFAGEKEYVRLVTMEEELLLYRRLKNVEEQLDEPFVRVHNSYIINIKLIVKIQDNHVYIGGKQIPIGDKFRNSFLEVINPQVF